MSWRRLAVLVRNLPPESATVQAELGDAATWTAQVELTAQVVDELRYLRYQHAMSHGGGRRPPPERVPRPEGIRGEQNRSPGSSRR